MEISHSRHYRQIDMKSSQERGFYQEDMNILIGYRAVPFIVESFFVQCFTFTGEINSDF